MIARAADPAHTDRHRWPRAGNGLAWPDVDRGTDRKMPITTAGPMMIAMPTVTLDGASCGHARETARLRKWACAATPQTTKSP